MLFLSRKPKLVRLLRALFNFAAGEYEDSNGKSLISENPVKRLSHTRAWYQIDRKQTVIKTHELPAWFKAVMEVKNERSTGKSSILMSYLCPTFYWNCLKTAKLNQNLVLCLFFLGLERQAITLSHVK